MLRRHLVGSPLGLAGLAAAAQSPDSRLPIRKSVLLGMLPRTMSYAERFQLAREVGFEAVEAPQTDDQAVAEEIKRAADGAKVRIHSVMNGDHWRFPLSSGDPEVVAKSMRAMRTSLHNAHLWGADTVLLVPAVVNPETSYKQAWERSRRQIGELIPLAEKLKVVIAVEEVWNKFLLSPIEFAAYVDSFQTPWVRAYFDVGNVVLFSYPQDWIRTLGKRIVKLHFKDFKFAKNGNKAEFVNLLDGEIDWKEVHAALREIGYSGNATVELRGGDKEYLADVSRRVDKILAGA
jgi:hexulose-6-phosphate isomerase